MSRIAFCWVAALGLFVVAPAWAPCARAAAPEVTLISPNGGEVLTGGEYKSVMYAATDDGTITEVRIYYRDGETAPWTEVARGLPNSGIFFWPVPNTPTAQARVRVWVRDNEALTAEDQSDGTFSILQTPGGFVATTLRDFELPGSQPFDIDGPLERVVICMACHAGYDTPVEPGHNFMGSMMAHAARDPLFYACLAIAEQDAPSSGDMCIRCHSPGGWLDGRSTPTDGSRLTLNDREGIACDMCHSMVDPIYKEGISPAFDLFVLQELDEIPNGYGEGQYVVDDALIRRGPFGDPEAPHAWLESPIHRAGEFCGTCHDVSNPAFERVAGSDYAPGPLDEAADTVDPSVLLPLERTYSEWKASEYASAGVFAPQFAGNKPGGVVSTCQDCHMRDVVGAGCGSEFAPIRQDLPLHDLTGGNTFVPYLVADLYPNEVQWPQLADGVARARYMLQNSALLDIGVGAVADSFRAEVTVTNNTGHKLPTGYPEGRRMWLNVIALDDQGAVIYQSGTYDTLTAVLTHDVGATIYEAKMGISWDLSDLTGLPMGESFHFALNDTLFKDNRIPPRGFTNAAFAVFGGQPVDPDRPGQRYFDGQYWDVASYGLPSETDRVIANLYYQTMSKEYAEFLRDENTTNNSGDILWDAWNRLGRSRPELMATDTLVLVPSGVDQSMSEMQSNTPLLRWTAGPNPFQDEVAMGIGLSRPADLVVEVYDVQGRHLAVVFSGRLPAGDHRLAWNGEDELGRDSGSGIFWMRLRAGPHTETRRVVRLR